MLLAPEIAKNELNISIKKSSNPMKIKEKNQNIFNNRASISINTE